MVIGEALRAKADTRDGGVFSLRRRAWGGADSASPVDVVVRWCNAMARVVAMMVDLLLTQGLGYKSSGHEHGSRSHGDKRMAAMVSEECWNSPTPPRQCPVSIMA